MRDPNFDIQKVVEYLQGTLNTISSAFGPDGILDSDFNPIYPDMTEDDLTSEDHQALDLEIFECEVCGWWYERSEESDEKEETCKDCEDHE